MNILEHDYLVPVVIGNDEKSLAKAKKLKKLTGLRVNIFAEKFTLFQRISYKCYKVSPMRKEFLADYLIFFSDTLDNFECPVIFIDKKDFSYVFGDECERIESAFMISDIKL
jgi:hypothetical protein